MEIVLRYVDVLIWPIVVLVIALIVLPVLKDLLGTSAVKVELFGVTIETDLSTFLRATEQAGGYLTPEEDQYLRKLLEAGRTECPSGGMTSDKRMLLRPLRNAGLIMTIPHGERLKRAEAICLTQLGKLVVKAKRRQSNR